MTTRRSASNVPKTSQAGPKRAQAPQRESVSGSSRMSRATSRLSAWMNGQPGLDYLMIRLIVLLLTGFGILMVTSSSMTWSVIEGSSVWGVALRQGMMVLVGLVMFWACLKIPPRVVRSAAVPILIGAFILLILVHIPGIGAGREEVGSQSWIALGPLRLQPSEVAKVAVAIFGAHYLADKQPRLDSFRSPYVIFLGIAMLVLALLFFEGDLGMAVSFAVVVMLLMIFAGVSAKLIVSVVVAGGAAGLLFIAAGSSFRSNRISVYFDALFGNFQDTRGIAFQSYQGFLSLADGSISGVGLGQSAAKWFYLPESRNDFIFAIIGEELGLWGGALVIILFALLGYFGLRTALRAADRYQQLLAATLTASVVSQAFINIGYVVGLLPVTGIQLPLISAGGTSVIITLTAMGLLANIARHEPQAVSGYQNYGRPVFDRILRIAEPEPPHPQGAMQQSQSPQSRGGTTPTLRRESAVAPKPGSRQERFGVPVTGRSSRQNSRQDREPREPRQSRDPGQSRQRLTPSPKRQHPPLKGGGGRGPSGRSGHYRGRGR